MNNEMCCAFVKLKGELNNRLNEDSMKWNRVGHFIQSIVEINLPTKRDGK